METKKLTRQQKDWYLTDILSSIQTDQSIKKLDFKDRLEFNRYLKTDDEFKDEIIQAEIDSCVFIENDMLNIHKKIDDHKLARIMLESYTKCLTYRNPSRYSQRIDLNVNQNISMRVNLETANKRVSEAFKHAVIETTAVALIKD